MKESNPELRMSAAGDRGLRELERKWRQFDSDDDAADYFQELARRGNYNTMSSVLLATGYQLFQRFILEPAPCLINYLNWHLQTFRDTMRKLQTRSMRRRRIMDEIISKKGDYLIYYDGRLELSWETLSDSATLTTAFFNSVASSMGSPWQRKARNLRYRQVPRVGESERSSVLCIEFSEI